MRVLWFGHTVKWRGGGRLKKEGKYEDEQKERGMVESAWSNPGPEGRLDEKIVGCKGVVEKGGEGWPERRESCF